MLVDQANRMSRPRVVFIIVNWNGVQDTLECIASVSKIAYANYEIVVIDDASSGVDVQIMRDTLGPLVHLVPLTEEHRFAGCNNIGIKHAQKQEAEYVMLLNNDTVVAPDFLDSLVDAAESDDKVGLASPIVYFYHDRERIQFGGARPVRWGLKTSAVRAIENEELIDSLYVNPAAMLIKLCKIDDMDLLPTTSQFSDCDLLYSLRALKAHLRLVYVPRSKIWHKGGLSRKRAGGAKYEWVIAEHVQLQYHFLRYPYYCFLTRAQWVSYASWFFLNRPFALVALMLTNPNWTTVTSIFQGVLKGIRRIGRSKRRSPTAEKESA